MSSFKKPLITVFVAIFLLSIPANAYIGPGAGFAILGSFMVFFFALVSGVASILIFPIRLLVRLIQVKRLGNKPYVKRVIVLGLDGLDPELCERFMEEGLLPNFKRLKTEGSFKRLNTTLPAMSPVAWSSFATGVNPGKHNIFDFLAPDRKSYLPILSSTKIIEPKRKLNLGRFQIPLEKPRIEILRKSKSFWRILGENWIFSQIIRVPITFPPERFYGALLSGMCVPDLRGSQGSFTYWHTQADEKKRTGGLELKLKRTKKGYRSYIPGPENTLSRNREELRIDFELWVKENGEYWLILPKEKIKLLEKKYTDWVKLKFSAGPLIKVYGIAKFMLIKGKNEPELYMTAVHIDPEAPAMQISYPGYFSMSLAKLIGRYATLGLAEDTWALNEGVIDEEGFLKQTWEYYQEREKLFFHCLRRVRKGMLAIVFDHTDRIQHSFYRCIDPKHPLYGTEQAKKYQEVIKEVYVCSDELLGKVMSKLRKKDVLFVISDHGFKSFRRGINLNSWLWQEGYLVCRSENGSGEFFKDVDWSKTRAYALGLSGIYLNLKGREANGIVEPGEEARKLVKEVCEKLSGIKDPETGEVAVLRAYDAYEHLSGPYLENSPEIIVGYNEGYRMDWEGTLGAVNNKIFSDNTKNWSGDHCIDPKLVPGVLFSNLKLIADNAWIGDIPATVLRLFDLRIPAYMDGKCLLTEAELEELRKG